MKKLVAIFLAFVLIGGILAGCGGKAPQAGGDSVQAAASGGENVGDTAAEGGNNASPAAGNDAAGGAGDSSVRSGDIYKEPGSELTDYVSALTEAETPFTKALEKESENVDMDILSAQMTLAMPELSLSMLGMYDILSLEDSPRKEGTMPLSGYHGIREKKGDEIRFTGSMEYTEDSNMHKKGDKVTEQGTLNTSKNTLAYEYKLENGGKVTARTIIETVILQDGTCLLQYFSSSGGSDGAVLPVSNAAFKRYNGNEYAALAASFDGGTDFKYDSIIGKGDIKAEAMASKYTVKGRFTVKDGKAEIAKK